MFITCSIMLADFLPPIIKDIEIVTKIFITGFVHFLSKGTDSFFYFARIFSTLVFSITQEATALNDMIKGST